MVVLGSRLKQLRTEANLTQSELGEKVHVTKVSICKYESGKAYPSFDLLIAFADFFNVTTDYLLGRVERREIDDFIRYYRK